MKKNLGIFLLLSFLFHQCSNGSTLNLAKKVEEPKTNLPFVIVTPSYNNSSYVGKNLQSIFSQDYNNYRLIYIDDASTDTTYEDVKNIIEEKGVIQKVELIRNEKNQKALYNLYKAIHSCKDEEIVIILDGDDWFSNDHVLSDLNKYYANKNVWMTYGQYMRHPDSQIGLCQAVSMEFLKNANMRKGPWYYSHLRTFYAGLFKKIRLEDLSQDGQFFPVTYDLAIMFPMLEMARTHAFFTPEVFYVYNWENPTCDQKIREKEQLAVEAYLRGKTVYSPLKLHPAKNEQKNACDLVVFSFNRPLQLFALLESTELHVKGMRKIAVLMRSDEEFIEGYNKVKERFPYVHFVEQPKINTRESFKPILLDLLFGKFGKDANHILFAVDDIIITEDIDVQKDMEILTKTDAYAFYYRLGKNINSCYMTKLFDHPLPEWTDLGNDVLAWQFEKGHGDWAYPNSVDFTLFRKKDLKKAFETLNYSYPNQLEGNWANIADLDRMGLCHTHSKMINIPMNVVSHVDAVHEKSFTIEELNEMFSEGLKIDIHALINFENKSPHISHTPSFVKR